MQSYSYLLGSHKGMVCIPYAAMTVIHSHGVFRDQMPSAWTTVVYLVLFHHAYERLTNKNEEKSLLVSDWE